MLSATLLILIIYNLLYMYIIIIIIIDLIINNQLKLLILLSKINYYCWSQDKTVILIREKYQSKRWIIDVDTWSYCSLPNLNETFCLSIYYGEAGTWKSQEARGSQRILSNQRNEKDAHVLWSLCSI